MKGLLAGVLLNFLCFLFKINPQKMIRKKYELSYSFLYDRQIKASFDLDGRTFYDRGGEKNLSF
tara:strand:+ start:343 stop:534 length:192 start_codon:yes stop_codon:yes gene_type:complete